MVKIRIKVPRKLAWKKIKITRPKKPWKTIIRKKRKAFA